ncbi:MAG: hypothetical protein J5756_04555 [Clostridia bacterium]|nr:hypothetical protein [Clostridia bacterium]
MINTKEIPEYALRAAARHTLDAIREWMEKKEGGAKSADVQVLRRTGEA